MELMDTRVVLNPGEGPATPHEAAVIAYQVYRDEHPLPDGWGQHFMMVPDLDVHFSCYLESPDYLVVIYLPQEPGPTGTGLLGLFRKDRSVPTTLEASAVVHQLLHPYLVPIPSRAHQPVSLDGDIEDRPLSYSPGADQSHLGLEVELRRSGGCEPASSARHERPIEVALPRALGNEPMNVIHDLQRLIDYESERFQTVAAWVHQQRARVLGTLATSGTPSPR